MAQKVILSPQSQMIKVDPMPSPFAAESMMGLLVINLLHFGHMIWFAMILPPGSQLLCEDALAGFVFLVSLLLLLFFQCLERFFLGALFIILTFRHNFSPV